jgi:hypothetical protein
VATAARAKRRATPRSVTSWPFTRDETELMRAIVSATSISRSWSTDLSRIGSLTTQTLPKASAGIYLDAQHPSA